MDCEKVGQSASEYFSQGYLCSEAVFMEVVKAAQIDSPLSDSDTKEKFAAGNC